MSERVFERGWFAGLEDRIAQGFFDEEPSLKKEAIERLEGARRARRYILEDKYTLLRGLIGDFVGLFGKQPATDEAAQFLEILRDELDAAKSDLSEIYGRGID